MKNIKSVIIYGVILILCLAAFAGYFFKSGFTDQKQTAAKQETVQSEKAAVAIVNPAVSETIAQKSSQPEILKEIVNPKFNTEAAQKGHIDELMKKGMEAPAPNPVVGIGRGEDYEKVTEDAVNNAGGLKDIIKKGDIVLIKPNLCVFSTPGSPVTTDYRTVGKVAQMALDLGASKVVVAEGNFGSNAFDKTSLIASKYGTLKNVSFFNFNDCDKEDCYELKPQKSLVGKAIFIPKAFMNADVVINIAKMKTHFITEAKVSLSLKNYYGIPPAKIYGQSGDKSGLHDLGLVESVIDLNRIRKADLNIIEGIVGGEGYGPVSNTPVKSGIILASKDSVALDTVGINFMGFKADESEIIKTAGNEKLGISDLSNIKVVGADLNSIKMKFRAAN